MDQLDIKIIQHLFYTTWPFQWAIRTPFSQVARELDVTDDTVRTRVRRMQEIGFLHSCETVVNPHAVGRILLVLDVGVMGEDKKDQAMETLCFLDGVRWINELESGGLRIFLFHPHDSPIDRAVGLVSKICGARTEHWVMPVPEPCVDLDLTDWRLVAAIRRTPRRPVKELEQVTGMSRRTIQRRLTRLIEGRAVFISPELDLGRMGTSRMVTVRVQPRSEKERRNAIRLFREERTLVASVTNSTLLGICVMDRNEQIRSLKDRIASTLGEGLAKVDVYLQRSTCHSWMDEVVQTMAKGKTGQRTDNPG